MHAYLGNGVVMTLLCVHTNFQSLLACFINRPFSKVKASILPGQGKAFDMKMISFIILNVYVTIVLSLIS